MFHSDICRLLPTGEALEYVRPEPDGEMWKYIDKKLLLFYNLVYVLSRGSSFDVLSTIAFEVKFKLVAHTIIGYQTFDACFGASKVFLCENFCVSIKLDKRKRNYFERRL